MNLPSISIVFKQEGANVFCPELRWLAGAYGRFFLSPVTFLCYYDQAKRDIILKSRVGDFWARGKRGAFHQVDKVDLGEAVDISYDVACQLEKEREALDDAQKLLNQVDKQKAQFFYIYETVAAGSYSKCVLAYDTGYDGHYIFDCPSRGFKKVCDDRVVLQVGRKAILKHFGVETLPHDNLNGRYYRVGIGRNSRIYVDIGEGPQMLNKVQSNGAWKIIAEDRVFPFPDEQLWDFSESLSGVSMQRLSREDVLNATFEMLMWGDERREFHDEGYIYNIKDRLDLRYFLRTDDGGGDVKSENIGKVYAVDYVGISYRLVENPYKSPNPYNSPIVEYQGLARLEWLGVNALPEKVVEISFDQVLKRILSAGGELEPSSPPYENEDYEN